MPARARPLSPHLEVYRWQISNTLSILHRLTGVALSVGLAVLAYWLVSLASGEDRYEEATTRILSPVGLALLLGWTFSFWYHLLNGVRHLFWDAGYGFEKESRHASGWFVVAGSVLLTLGVAFFVWHGSQA